MAADKAVPQESGTTGNVSSRLHAQQSDPSMLGYKAVRAAAALLARTIVVQGATITGTIVLARILTPAQFGLYAVIALIVSFFSAFSDIGLGAALIQQQREPEPVELATAFTLQCILIAAVTATGFILAPLLRAVYDFDDASIWLMRVLLLSVPLSLFRTIPAILLERQLSFGRLGFVEAGEVLTFQGSTIVFALLGFGVWSLVWATLLRAIIGVLLVQTALPWKPTVLLSAHHARRLTRFGLPFQGQAILNVTKEAMTPTVLALFIGTSAVGYINWAYMVATAPLLVTMIFSRVTFPAFARVQHDRGRLTGMVERSIRLSAIAFLPISCLLMGAGPQLVTHIFTDKWLPALPAFYLFSLALWAGPLIGASFFSLLYATNHARVALSFVVAYTLLDWIIGVPFVALFGFMGIPMKSLVVSLITLPPLLYFVGTIVPIRILPQLMRPLAASIGVTFIEVGLLRILPDTLFVLIASSSICVCMYALLIAIVERRTLQALANELLPPSLRRFRPIQFYFTM